MPLTHRRPHLAFVKLWTLALAAFVLAGCAATQPVVSSEQMPFDQAANVAAEGLFKSGLGSGSRRVVVLDPTLDASTGQQTAATQRLDKIIGDLAVRDAAQVELVPFRSASLARAQLLLAGTLTRAEGAYRINLALVDIQSGKVIAQSSALAQQKGTDMSPLAYYRDSPILVKDKVTDGYVRTSSALPGQPADPVYLERIATATVLNDATVLYNSARYREALGQYRSALASPAGDQVRALTGLYLSLAKLGQNAEAEEAFGRLVSYGIAYNSLGMKFLFNPGSTDFWSDPKVSSAYAMWLRQIARQGANAKVCMDIVGHTSKTGTEAVNDQLSLRRAAYIKQRLASESAAMANRTRAQGMGSRENIVGSGTDDVVDAPDRRVEFTITECGKP